MIKRGMVLRPPTRLCGPFDKSFRQKLFHLQIERQNFSIAIARQGQISPFPKNFGGVPIERTKSKRLFFLLRFAGAIDRRMSAASCFSKRRYF